MSALQGQVGGSHYKNMAMQPFEFTMANRWDPLAHTILKYVSRHSVKGGKQDLLKALHCVHLRLELTAKYTLSTPVMAFIPMEDFARANNLSGTPEHAALDSLSEWVWAGTDQYSAETAELIQKLIDYRYPGEPE